MAGHRRGTQRPKLATARANRRRAQLATELGAAGSVPGLRVAAAADYVRGALGQAPDQDLSALIDQMVAATEKIRALRMREDLAAQLTAAATPRERFSIATRALRAAIGSGPASHAVQLAAEQIVHALAKHGDQLHSTTAGGR